MERLPMNLHPTKGITRIRGIFVLILLVFGFAFPSLSQSVNGLKEQVFFHTPKTLYFSGDKIWFEAQVSLGTQPSSSQVLYAELVDRNSNSIAHVKVPLQTGKAVNFISISDQIASDHYLLRVYTRISPYLDLNQGVAQQLVTVINPKIPPKEATSSSRIDLPSSKSKMTKKVFHTRRHSAKVEFKRALIKRIPPGSLILLIRIATQINNLFFLWIA